MFKLEAGPLSFSTPWIISSTKDTSYRQIRLLEPHPTLMTERQLSTSWTSSNTSFSAGRRGEAGLARFACSGRFPGWVPDGLVIVLLHCFGVPWTDLQSCCIMYFTVCLQCFTKVLGSGCGLSWVAWGGSRFGCFGLFLDQLSEGFAGLGPLMPPPGACFFPVAFGGPVLVNYNFSAF